MRAFDILLFCLCINAAITIIDVSGMGAAFTGHPGVGFFAQQTGGVWSHDLTGLNALSNPSSALGGDMFLVAASWVIEASFAMFGFLIAAVTVIPTLMLVFFFPIWLALPLQGLIYLVYMSAYVQWKSGRSLFSFW